MSECLISLLGLDNLKGVPKQVSYFFSIVGSSDVYGITEKLVS